VIPTQARAHRRKERVATGQRQVFARELERVGASARCTTHHHRLPAITGQCNHGRLGTRLVNGIDQPGVGGDQRCSVVSRDEVIDQRNRTVWRDVGNAASHHLGFRGAHRALECLHLTVDVGLGDMIEINQRDPTHAASRQRLCAP